MPRFPIDKEQITEDLVIITGSDFKHITKVLRLKEGDLIDLFDNNSTEYRGKITEINAKGITVRIQDFWAIETESKLQIDLYQSIIKPNKMDLLVQKATELGVSNIIPMTTERTQKNLQVKDERLNKISVESAKQCRRSKPPIVSETISFKEALETDSDYDLKLILYENSEVSLKNHLKNYSKNVDRISVLIGPEGGFTEDEVSLAEKNSYISLGLGKRILRAETAAITIISLLQFQLGDLG